MREERQDSQRKQERGPRITLHRDIRLCLKRDIFLDHSVFKFQKLPFLLKPFYLGSLSLTTEIVLISTVFRASRKKWIQ